MKNIKHNIDLIVHKSIADIRAEASRAYLGFLWWFLEPVMYMMVFYLVFQSGLRSGGEGFIPFLLSGLVVWKWFVSAVQGGSAALARNAVVIQHIYLPKYIFPCVVILSNTYKFIVILPIFLFFLIVAFHAQPGIAWLLIPLMILVQLLFIMAVTILVAAIIPFAQDLRMLLDNIIVMLFFMSGIFYDITTMSGVTRDLLMLNPMAIIITDYRLILLHGEMPQWQGLLYVILLSLILLALALFVINKFDRIYPKIINR